MWALYGSCLGLIKAQLNNLSVFKGLSMPSVTWEYKHSEVVILICNTYIKDFFVIVAVA